MFGKKLLLLLGGYVVWNVVNSIYNNTKWKDLKKEMKIAKKSWFDSKKVVINNFLETHKNILDSLKKDVLTEENIALFNKKKEDALSVINEYKKSWEELLKDLKWKWSDFVNSAKDEISDIYEEKKSKFKKSEIKSSKKNSKK